MHEVDFQDVKNSTMLSNHPDPIRTKGHTVRRLINNDRRSRETMDNNPLRICETDYRDEDTFGKSLFCGRFHLHDSCVIRHAKCFKCGKVRHIRSVCMITNNFTASNIKHFKIQLRKIEASLRSY